MTISKGLVNVLPKIVGFLRVFKFPAVCKVNQVHEQHDKTYRFEIFHMMSCSSKYHCLFCRLDYRVQQVNEDS